MGNAAYGSTGAVALNLYVDVVVAGVFFSNNRNIVFRRKKKEDEIAANVFMDVMKWQLRENNKTRFFESWKFANW